MPLQSIGPQDDKPLQDVADRLAKSHKIVVISGAGISTSCGIPDFRSKDGLYNIIPDQLPSPTSSVPSTPSENRLSSEDYFPPSQSSGTSSSSRRSCSSPYPKLKGQDLFDANVWKTPHATELFYRFIASLRQKIRDEVHETAPTHKFIRTLRDGGRLMRCYTQNIDGLERREGLSMDLNRGKGTKKRFMKQIWEAPRPAETRNSDADGGCEVVPLHGDLEVLRCTLCQGTCQWNDEATAGYMNGIAPECSQCVVKSCSRQEKGKRGVAVGSLRPNIVLYGEEHPSNQALASLVPFDLMSGPEILIIMGTSLKVHGLQKVVREFAKRVHARKDGKGRVVLVNKTKPAASVWEKVIDSYIEMDCDDWVKDLRKRREDLWLRQGELNLKTTKATARKRKYTDDSTTPSKRPKVVVEIPTKRQSIGAKPQSDRVIEARPDSHLMTPPPSRGKGSAGSPFGALKAEALVPQHPSSFAFQRRMHDDLFKSLFRSPIRPEPSPLRNTWKPSIGNAAGGLSPDRPQIFSPIEERRTKLRVYQDPDLECRESDDRTPEEDASVLETPTKVRVLRQTLDSRLNSRTVNEKDVKSVSWPTDETLGLLRQQSRSGGL